MTWMGILPDLMGSQPCCLTWCGHVIALITNYPLSCCTLEGGVAVAVAATMTGQQQEDRQSLSR